MTTMLSLILAFMLSIGGSPAASVNPASCPVDTGIQAPIDNNCTINHFSEDYNQKTASRANSKKTGKSPSIKELETVNSIKFSRFLNEKLRQAGYFDHKSYRFNSVDPVINKAGALLKPQMWNLYAYCDNNPITFFDPNGREPNKSQATNPTKLINYINSTKGGTARNKLAVLGKYGTLGGASPSKKRYIYTEKAGWIDLVHFFNVAAELDKLSGIDRIGAWMFGGFALWQKTKEIENNQAARGLIGTAWSYEDAPSNYYGWLFWKFYYDPNGNLGDQMQRFLEDYGGTNPQNAPNWNQMWSKENPKKRQFPQNKSFNPKFTK